MQQAVDILEGRLFDDEPAARERDIQPLLLLEAALHRREGLILVTSTDSRASSALVRSALENAGDSTTAVTVSADHAEPFSAIDLLLEAASLDLGERSTDKFTAAYGLIGRAEMRGGSVVVVVDHADATSIAELERLRVALDVGAGENRPVQLVLSGNRSFLSRLKAKDARGLWTRIGTRIDVPDGASMKQRASSEEGTPTSNEPEKARRAPWITFTTAGVLLATLLLAASLAGRGGDQPEVRTLATTVEPARPIGAATGAAEAPPSALGAPGAVTPPATPAANIAATPPTAAPVIGSPVAPATPTSSPQAADARPNSATQPTGSPHVSSWMDVETLRGSTRLDSKGAGPALDTPSADQAASPSSAPAQAAASPASSSPSAATPSPSNAGTAAPGSAVTASPSSPTAASPSSIATASPSSATSSRPATLGAADSRAALDTKTAGPAIIPGSALAPTQSAPASQPSAGKPASGPAPSQLAASTPPPAHALGSATGAFPATPAAPAPTKADEPAAAPKGAQVVEVAPPPSSAAAAPSNAAHPSPPPAPATATTATAKAEPAKPASNPAAAAASPTTKPAPVTTAAVGSRPGFDIQVAAFGKLANAAALRDSLAAEFPSTRVEETRVGDAPFFRVRVVGIPTAAEAARVEERLRALGHQPVRYASEQPKS